MRRGVHTAELLQNCQSTQLWYSESEDAPVDEVNPRSKAKTGDEVVPHSHVDEDGVERVEESG